MTIRTLLVFGLAMITAACGGSASAPTGPAPSSTSPAPTSGASIAGTVRSGASSLTSAGTGATMTGLTVSVSGTSITTTVDAAGRFTLSGVPAGDHQLVFSGPVTATVQITQVQTGETITLVLKVAGTSITVESQARAYGAEEQLEGRVEAVPPTTTAGSMRVAGRTVTTNASTEIRQGNITRTIGDFRVGYRVHVKGQTLGTSLLASAIFLQNDNIPDEDDDDDDDDNDEQDSSASIHGTLQALSGTAPALRLTVGSTAVRTTSDTEVKRRGDVQSLASLKVGQELHVVGTRQPDGSLIARKIEIEGDATGGEFEIEGSAGGVSGTCPAITFSVNGYNVRTNGATTFDGTTCSAVKSGTKVNVKGTVESGGVVLATRVRLR